MPKRSSAKPAKFFSLFVPQIDWFQDLLKTKAQGRSLSCFLLQLVVEDLHERELISEKRYQSYQSYERPKIQNTRFVNREEWHSTFSLYIPNHSDQQWLRKVLETDFLKKNCHRKSRSIYIWDLFVKKNLEELKPDQVQEWAREIKGENRPVRVPQAS